MVRFAQRNIWSESHWRLYERACESVIFCIKTTVVRRELGFDDLIEVDYCKALAFPQYIRQRFNDGNTCHGFFVDNRLATIGWTSPGYIELDVGQRMPCPAALGMFDFYTYKEYRSRGYYTSALMQLILAAQHSGFGKAYIAVDPGNLPSIKGIERVGFTQAMRITRRIRFGVRTFAKEDVIP